MKTRLLFLICSLTLVLSACQSPADDEDTPDEVEIPATSEDQPGSVPIEIGEESAEIVSEIGGNGIPPGALPPQALTYLGAFRLPDDSGEMGWDYSGHGMTYFPQSDPGDTGDGFPGSLFVVGHDQQLYVAEISIPEPVISNNLHDLPTAQTLQPFADITGGAISEDLDIPRIGIEYLQAKDDQDEAKIHFALGQHFQEFEPSHGWTSLDLSNPNPAGLWVFDGYSNYTTNDYLLTIPEEWAADFGISYPLTTGRFREGVWGGFGPALFAYDPWGDGDPPAQGGTLTAIQPLLLYGIQIEGASDILTDNTMRMDGYGEADHWWGGAWLTSNEGDAVIFTGTKAQGENWYGFGNGVRWDYDCAENPEIDCPEVPDFPYDNRGYWAESYIPAVLFFNPDDLGKVAVSEMATYDPQPYALLDLTPYWYDPVTRPEIYKRDLVGAAAFDRENRLLYIIERLADEYKSLIHVFKIGGNE